MKVKLGILVGILFFLVSAVVWAQGTRVRVAYSAMSGSIAWVWAAKEGNYFQKHGLNVDLVYVGGTAQLFQSMLAGEIAFGIGGGPAILHSNMQGRSIVGIAGTLNRMIMKIMTTPQIRTPKEFRGKHIAITRFGTSTDFAARLFLKSVGLAAERDVALLQVGSVPNILAALKSGTSQAGALSPPAHLQAEKMGFSELADLSRGDIYYPFTYVVVTPGFLEKNNHLVTPFLSGVIEGVHRFKTDKTFAKILIAKYLRVNDEQLLEHTHQLFSDFFETVPYIKSEGLVSLAQILGEKEPRIEALKIDSIIDNRFVRGLEASGFIKNVYK